MTAALLILILSGALGISVSSVHAGPISDIDDSIDALDRILRKSVDVQGTSWSTSGPMKLKVKGSPSMHASATADLFFGPQEVEFDSDNTLLASDEFLLILDNGEALLPISGTYQQKFASKPPKLFLETVPLEDGLGSFLEDLEKAEGVHLRRATLKIKSKLRQRQLLFKIKLKLKFSVDTGGKGVLKYRGEGPQANN